ncbi:beta/gamma crystallin-related protein [Myxococcus sp. RHSTA-1-4]|uniref:beta/gamma crystallin-related protein n=1 Tax=Myxococcus sp. RHSTA-1-4 TaxID=2874601 RepID=UPI001CBB8C18|nr:beta/gamma crystallin-related protein [Myxococcus sp. RHSTA-1-4]MBZ4422484.1 Development-specific protein S [Myxococcus sp. RHSTA-1-4]
MADKIIVYYEKDFRGNKAELPVGDYTRAELKSKYGIDNNTISSVKVPPGLKAVLFKGDNFSDKSMDVVADAHELDWMHNNCSSIKIMPYEKRRATFFKKEDFQGKDVSLPPGQYTQAELERYGIDNNTVSSVKVPSGLKVVLFKEDNFHGQQLPLSADAKDLHALNNATSSVKIS